MQRLFSVFPAGLAGAGILILRLALGLYLIAQGAAALLVALQRSPQPDLAVVPLSVWWILAGLCISIGFLTPLVQWSVAMTFGVVWISPRLAPVWTLLSASPAVVLAFGLVVSASLALIGPSAYSLDAYLFGRRQIDIPAKRPARRADDVDRH